MPGPSREYRKKWSSLADEIFADDLYAKSNWEDIRDNNYYHNELQLSLW